MKTLTLRGIPKISLDCGLYRNHLLADFPEYKRVFDLYEVPDQMNLVCSVEQAKAAFEGAFGATLSFHRLGELNRDLKARNCPIVPNRDDVMGFMARDGVRLNKYLVAIAGQKEQDGNVKDIHVGTILHEYGHYVEERHQAQLRKRGNEWRQTSHWVASRWVNAVRQPLTFEGIDFAADELAAWMNAVWISWLMDADRNYVVTGLVLDAVSNPDFPAEFVTQALPDLHAILTNRRVAEKLFRSTAQGASFDDFFKQGTETSRCCQIDEATMNIFGYLLDLHVARRNAAVAAKKSAMQMAA